MTSIGAETDKPEKRWKRHAYWLLPVLVGAVLAIPQLPHPFWHDEMYTDMYFASSPSIALFDYHLPNNHILFSLEWWFFKLFVTDPGYWRLLPMAHFLLAAAFMAWAGKRFTGDDLGGMLSGLVFATAHTTVNFGMELRGYSPSLSFMAIALYGLARWRGTSGPGFRWLVLYGVMAFLAVGTVPVNLAAFAPLAVWVWWTTLPRRTPGGGRVADPRGHWRPFAWCALTPFLGLVFLIPVWSFLAESVRAGSSMAKLVFLIHFPYAATWDFLWLPAAGGIAWAVAARAGKSAAPAGKDRGRSRARTEASSGSGPDRPALGEAAAFLALSVLVPMACALILPRTPNDYTMIATIPAVCLGLGWTTRELLRRAEGGLSDKAFRRLVGAMVVAMIFLGARRESLVPLWPNTLNRFDLNPWLVDNEGIDVRGMNLYHQRYQNNYNAIDSVDWLAEYMGVGGDDVFLVVAEGGDVMPLATYWEWRHGAAFPNSLSMVLDDDRYRQAQRDGVEAQWATDWAKFSRHFIVVSEQEYPTPKLFNLMTPRNHGVLIRLHQNAQYRIFEWVPSEGAARRARDEGKPVEVVDTVLRKPFP